MTSTLVLPWVALVLVVFVAGSIWRAWRYARAPMHLRWDLYPVAHEPAPRRDHGGSYLEEREWWTRPRERSLLGEAVFMAEEILFLKGVRANNRRLWWGSFPFHWGLYLLVLTTVGIFLGVAGWRLPLDSGLLSLGALTGGGLVLAGSVILLVLRSTDPKLRPYTAPVDRLNLLFLALFGALCVGVAVRYGLGHVVTVLSGVLRGHEVRVGRLLAAQMAVGGLFLMYMPFTRMVHFFAKYFTYHDVRWDDTPMEPGSPLADRLAAALNYGVDWSAGHVRTGKTWAEVATTLPDEEKGGKA